MSEISKNDILIFEDDAVKSKITGICLMIFGSFFTLLSWNLTKLFGFNDLLAQLIGTAIFAFVGVAVIFAGYLFFKTTPKKLVLDASVRKIFYEEKLPSHTETKKFDFAEIYKLETEETDLENARIYTSYIVIGGGLRLEIPTRKVHDKAAQDEICLQIREFAGIGLNSQ
ncbi:MAG: hypothetical protein LUM44_01495 [Pyrinomonadaceae bacterium]|nr:hypothetical protein [Pyrinomonadaceae bacterium]